MNNPLTELLQNIITFNNKKIFIVITDDYIPWFSAKDVAILLEYNRPIDAIQKHVFNENKTTFENLKQYVTNIPTNAQDGTVFINEQGLYSLILSSRKQIAVQFKSWITNIVLPSIRKFGTYSVDNHNQKELDKLNDKIRKLKQKNNRLEEKNQTLEEQKLTLLNNLKKNIFEYGGVVYIIQMFDTPNKRLFKIGRSANLNKRVSTYNTSSPNKFQVVYVLKVDDPVAVENCLKAILHKYIYIERKEYYDCDLDTMIAAFKKCAKIVDEPIICDDCDKTIDTLEGLANHYAKDHSNHVQQHTIQHAGYWRKTVAF